MASRGDPVELRAIRDLSAAGPAPGTMVITVQAAPPSPPTAEELARTVADLAIVRRCPWRAAPRCGCSPARCALAGGRTVTDRQCLACAAQYGDA